MDINITLAAIARELPKGHSDLTRVMEAYSRAQYGSDVCPNAWDEFEATAREVMLDNGIDTDGEEEYLADLRGRYM